MTSTRPQALAEHTARAQARILHLADQHTESTPVHDALLAEFEQARHAGVTAEFGTQGDASPRWQRFDWALAIGAVLLLAGLFSLLLIDGAAK